MRYTTSLTALCMALVSHTAYAAGLLPLPDQMPRDGAPQQYQQASYQQPAYRQPAYQQRYQPAAPLYQPTAPVAAQPVQPYQQPVQYEQAAQYQQPIAAQASYYNAPQSAAPATAHKPWYVGFNAQYAVIEDHDYAYRSGGITYRGDLEFDDGFGLGAQVGYRVHPNVRVEGEAAFRSSDLDKGTVRAHNAAGTQVGQATVSGDDYGFETTNLMANVYVDVPLEFAPKLVPYIGGGVGWSFQTNGEEADSFAYQGMAGLGYQVADDVTLNVGYRYFAADGYEMGPLGDFDGSTHIIEAGGRLAF